MQEYLIASYIITGFISLFGTLVYIDPPCYGKDRKKILGGICTGFTVFILAPIVAPLAVLTSIVYSIIYCSGIEISLNKDKEE